MSFIKAFIKTPTGQKLSRLYNDSKIKSGSLVGTDKFGNKYHNSRINFFQIFRSQNRNFRFIICGVAKLTNLGRDRWVEFEGGWRSYDATKIPPEWHAWLHHFSDLNGDKLRENFAPIYRSDSFGNKTATDNAYSPTNFVFNEDSKKLKADRKQQDFKEIIDELKRKQDE